ncbi:PREDICTED: circadian clock-controlled protein-like isoform X2 [Rhagoletis zephyria]|uniref:circadian clock-controlled protein-like isoform X2 n=1 Tax=Rhagoletis zephyria TaxID=28612 RepID=UPI00081142E4|nr:PREDICTED: circadian clock-controlled protein-like isoform X2 [Rhagoletis zephyria]
MHSNCGFGANHKLVLLTLVALSLQWQVFAVDFPAPITKCHFGDEKCLIEQAHKLLKKAATGIPENNIPSLEPLKVEKIEMLGDKNSALKVDLVMSDVEFYNYTKAKLLSIKGFSKDLSKPMKLVSQNINPRMTIKAKYKVNGNILVLPIKGEGLLTMVLDNVKSRIVTTMKPEQRNGKTYLIVDNIKLESKLDNVITDMTNLFNGDKTLSDSILKVMNENWRVLSDELTPRINEALAHKFEELLPKLFKDIPYEDYFLPE